MQMFGKKRGYSRREVDALFVRINAKLATPDEIRNAAFPVQWGGYPMREIDQALDDALRELGGEAPGGWYGSPAGPPQGQW